MECRHRHEHGGVAHRDAVGDFQQGDQLSGFFLQEEDTDADGDPQTSDGIFVFDNGFGPDVDVGDVVRVQGTVQEFFDLTELTMIGNMEDRGYGDTATPSMISLPRSSVDDWETTEGMATAINQSGSLRMQSYRIGMALADQGVPPSRRAELVARLASEFESIFCVRCCWWQS